MKNKFLKIISKPKLVIPVFAIIGIVCVIFLYGRIGKAPVVEIGSEIKNQTIISSGSNIDLSFPKSGRIAQVLATNGQEVHKGDMLAKLSAPDSEGTVSQAKGALELAEAQYASLNSQYASTKKQQDLIILNAYNTLLSSGLEATADKQNTNTPIVSGTYICGKEGSYKINPYKSSDSDTGFSFEYSGLEKGISSIKTENPVTIGECGLQIKWSNITNFDDSIEWTINIPNTKSSVYLANKNAYELALENKEKILSDLAFTIGDGSDTSVAKATVNAARGAYEAALGAYGNNLIVSPADGVVNFIDENLKVGQSVTPNKTVISITVK